jgi:Rab-GTPase-TBC domain
MNYVMGFLLLKFKDEKTTYLAFHKLMDIYLKEAYSKDFTKLKILFYEFEQCLSLFLPTIYNQFKVFFKKFVGK